jgi:CRP/FNR family cyclic AMP-dependent transcriptional regulator
MLVLGRADFARCLPENSSLSYAILRGLVRACATPTGRSNRWPCSTSTAAWPARCWTWPRRQRREDHPPQGVAQDMAKVVGASREMVSRVMKDLEERGVIETQETARWSQGAPQHRLNARPACRAPCEGQLVPQARGQGAATMSP